MSVTQKKVIYFTDDTKPTTAESAEISRLRDLAASPYLIQVRNGGGTAKMENIESCDYVAGTVPTAYSSVDDFGGDGEIDEDRPLAFAAVPTTMAISSGTKQAMAVACVGSNAEDAAIEDVTTSVAWTSSDATKATVGAATGVVTKVAAGTATITATYTYATGKTITDTIAVTVS